MSGKDIWSELLIPYQGLEFSTLSRALARSRGISMQFGVVTGIQRSGRTMWQVLVTPDTAEKLGNGLEQPEYWRQRSDADDGEITPESEQRVRDQSDSEFRELKEFLGSDADDWE